MMKRTILAVGMVMVVMAADTALAQGLQAPYESRDIQSLIVTFMRAVVMLALPVIALFIVFAGFKFVAAQGNEGKISEAKDNLKYVLYGSALILGAWVLATLIGGTVKQVLGN